MSIAAIGQTSSDNRLQHRLPSLIADLYPGAFHGDEDALVTACGDLGEMIEAIMLFAVRTGGEEAMERVTAALMPKPESTLQRQ